MNPTHPAGPHHGYWLLFLDTTTPDNGYRQLTATPIQPGRTVTPTIFRYAPATNPDRGSARRRRKPRFADALTALSDCLATRPDWPILIPEPHLATIRTYVWHTFTEPIAKRLPPATPITVPPDIPGTALAYTIHITKHMDTWAVPPTHGVGWCPDTRDPWWASAHATTNRVTALDATTTPYRDGAIYQIPNKQTIGIYGIPVAHTAAITQWATTHTHTLIDLTPATLPDTFEDTLPERVGQCDWILAGRTPTHLPELIADRLINRIAHLNLPVVDATHVDAGFALTDARWYPAAGASMTTHTGTPSPTPLTGRPLPPCDGQRSTNSPPH